MLQEEMMKLRRQMEERRGLEHRVRQREREKEVQKAQRSLNCWKRIRDMRVIQEERAYRFYCRRTLRRVLLALLDLVTQERLIEWDRENLAQEHNVRRILLKSLQAWRQLPSMLRRERQRDKRRERLSRKVAEVLPDFCSGPT
uniref:KIAA1407 n=1 Tax=Iconisemion striatum TaxID=60296 RepID=A0A1A7YNF3_9TELE